MLLLRGKLLLLLQGKLLLYKAASICRGEYHTLARRGLQDCWALRSARGPLGDQRHLLLRLLLHARRGRWLLVGLLLCWLHQLLLGRLEEDSGACSYRCTRGEFPLRMRGPCCWGLSFEFSRRSNDRQS